MSRNLDAELLVCSLKTSDVAHSIDVYFLVESDHCLNVTKPSNVTLEPNLNSKLVSASSMLVPNLFIGTPRVCNFILLLIVWVRSFSKMLPSMKFAEDKVLVFVLLREKCQTVQL